MNNKIILIVEDDFGIAELIKGELESIGMTVVHMGMGNSALKWLESNIPALMILDHSLPDMNSVEFIETLNNKMKFLRLFLQPATEMKISRFK
jgi:DNA-binding response OmpR family regulator